MTKLPVKASRQNLVLTTFSPCNRSLDHKKCKAFRGTQSGKLLSWHLTTDCLWLCMNPDVGSHEYKRWLLQIHMLAFTDPDVGSYGFTLAFKDPDVGSYGSRCWLLQIHTMALTHPNVGSEGSRFLILQIHMLAFMDPDVGSYGFTCWLLRIHKLALTNPRVVSYEVTCWLLRIHMLALTDPDVGCHERIDVKFGTSKNVFLQSSPKDTNYKPYM